MQFSTADLMKLDKLPEHILHDLKAVLNHHGYVVHRKRGRSKVIDKLLKEPRK